MEIVLTLVAAVLLLALILRFIPWRGRPLYAHLYHWWVIRRGTRRMLRRAERVHAPSQREEPSVETSSRPVPLSSLEAHGQPPRQPETVVLPPRGATPDDAPPTTPPAEWVKLDPKRARAEAEAVGLHVINADDGSDALAAWLLNAVGLSVLIILAVWLGSGGYAVIERWLP